MQEYAAAAREILSTLLGLLQLDTQLPEPTIEGDQLFFQIETQDAGRVIGRTAQNLDALQFILNRMMSRRFDDAPYCVVDAGHYREQRREKLLADAAAALERVRATGRSWRMPLLNSMERRIIHQALKNCPDILTHSEDEEPDGRKRVVISLDPAYTAPAEPEADDGAEPGDVPGEAAPAADGGDGGAPAPDAPSF